VKPFDQPLIQARGGPFLMRGGGCQNCCTPFSHRQQGKCSQADGGTRRNLHRIPATLQFNTAVMSTESNRQARQSAAQKGQGPALFLAPSPSRWAPVLFTLCSPSPVVTYSSPPGSGKSLAAGTVPLYSLQCRTRGRTLVQARIRRPAGCCAALLPLCVPLSGLLNIKRVEC